MFRGEVPQHDEGDVPSSLITDSMIPDKPDPSEVGQLHLEVLLVTLSEMVTLPKKLT